MAEKSKSHWIGMAGIHGCLPSTCEVYHSKQDAVESLAQLHDLTRTQVRRLKLDFIMELHPDQGNEYAEIEECTCDTPNIHSDTGGFDA